MKTSINRVVSVIRREFKERVMKKSFLILTLLTPLLFGALMIVPSLLWMVKSEKVNSIVVFDETGYMFKGLQETPKEGAGKKKSGEEFEEALVKFSEAPKDARIDDYEVKVSSDESGLDGLLEIKKDEKGEVTTIYYGKNIGNIRLVSYLEKRLNGVLLKSNLDKNGISEDVGKELSKRIEIKAIKLEKGGKKKESSFLTEYFKAFFSSMLLYMLIVGYGQTLMRGVMEEKNSRVVEILLSSLRPFELLLGKILGIASVGLLQYIIWLAIGGGLFLANPLNFTASMGKSIIKPEELVLFVVFFGLGFFFYASIFAAVGAMCSTDQETQQLQIPIVIMLILPVLLLGMILQNPNAAWVVALSMFPLFSPTLMMTRVAIMPVPAWQILGSIGMLILGIIFMAWAGGKIYRIGILMTGKRPNLIEVFRWMKSS
jgi:ABC-2 type transport system permease protein